MERLLCKLALAICSYLQLSISPCSATPQDLEGQDIKPQHLQSHNCFSNPLIFVEQGTYLPGKIVNASNSDLAGVLSVSIISLINHSLFNNTQLIPDNRRRFLTELGLCGRSLQEDTLKQGLHLRIAQVRYGDCEGIDRPVVYEDVLINQQTGQYARLKDRNKEQLQIEKQGTQFYIHFHNNDVTIKGYLTVNGDLKIDQLNSAAYGVNLQTFGTLLFTSSSTAPVLSLSSLNVRNQATLSCQTLICSAVGDEHAGFIVNGPSGTLNVAHKISIYKGQLYNYGKLSFAQGGLIDLHGNNLYNLPTGWNPLFPATNQDNGIYTDGPLRINHVQYFFNRAALNASSAGGSFNIDSQIFEDEGSSSKAQS
jgi:hypothetical protein